MAMYQMMQETSREDLALQMARQCWDVCYNQPFSTADFASGMLSEANAKLAHKCQNKCIARHFEVLNLQMAARQQREKEAALGLPPGSLNEEHH